jgi:phosphatidate cytidylyltransferase
VPEGENKEDLFEDLDKFFAPIQDVDWPESTTATPAPRRNEPAPEDTAAFDEPLAAEREADERGEPERDPVEVPEGVARGGEDEISLDAFTEPPSAYVDLPGADDQDEEAAELDEDLEAGPSPEAVEAAADHFAASVRDEVRIEDDEQPVVFPPGDRSSSGDVGGDPGEGFGAPPRSEEPARSVRVGAEGLGGPSWQEPTTMEVGSFERESRPGGRDVPAAFLTGLVLAAAAIGSLAWDPAAFAVVAGVIVLWAQGELYRALQTHHFQPATALGLAGGGLILGAAYFSGEPAILAMFVMSIGATFLWYMATPASHRKGTVANVGVTVLGIAYVPLLASFALLTLELEDGPALVVSIVALTFVYDTAAFIIGSWWGVHPLAPQISPRKSVQGAVGATLVVMAVSIGAVAASVELFTPITHSVGLALVVSVFAPLGDLAESLLKRDLGIKDMGSVLPGHGGVLDRIDSLLFVAPAAFLFLRLILT